MVRNTRSVKGQVFRNQGTIDAQLWDSIQDSLFVEPTYGSSRVEAYSVGLLLKAVEVVTSVAEEPNQDDERNDEPDFSSPETGLGTDEESKLNRVVALRTPEDITDYLNETPNFRAFFICQRFSWAPLSITSHLFAELMVRARISPRLKRFMIYLGEREREVEISPPALRFTRSFSTKGTSPQGHECIYGLRYIARRNDRGDTEKPFKQWSFRQSVIFCRYAPGEDGASWLFITLSQHMRNQLDSVVADQGSFDDLDPFEIHFLLIESAISSWRQYLVDLSEETDANQAHVLGTSPDDEGPLDLHESGRRQELLILDDKISDARLATSATADTLSALLSAWESTNESTADSSYTELVRASFEHQKRDLQLITLQLENLRHKLDGVTNVLTGFLDLSSGFSLQNLVKESGKENEEMRKLSARMHRLAEKSTQDAAAVKVLTILTLIYLPVTVVSNFFSTSFVNTEILPDGSGTIIVYGDWWILLAVSIPLTLVTIGVWLVWTRIQAKPHGQPWWWYVLGARKSNRQPKTADAISVSGAEMEEVHQVRMLVRTSSELC